MDAKERALRDEIEANARLVAEAHQFRHLDSSAGWHTGDELIIDTDPSSGEPIRGTITAVDDGKITLSVWMPIDMAAAFIAFTRPRP